jgi:hypothetical protein
MPVDHPMPALCLRQLAPLVLKRSNTAGEMPVHTLVLSGHWSLDDDVIEGVAPKLGNLKQCHMDGVKEVNDAVLTLLKEKSRLEVLNLAGCEHLTDGNFQFLAHGSGSLLYLDISDTKISPNSIKLFAENSPLLEVLLMKRCHNLSDVGIKAVGDLARLREFSVHHCDKVSGKSVAAFKQMKLEIFDIGFCKDVADNSVLQIIKQNPDLKVFNVSHASLTDIAVKMLGKKCKRIIDLDIAFSRVTSEGLRATLSRLRLRRLNLAGIKGITDVDVANVAEFCPNLEFFNLRFQEFLTDASCTSMEQLHKLEEVILFGLKHVTCAAIESLLKACPLRVVAVWRCEIQQADIQRLMEEHPLCNIID